MANRNNLPVLVFDFDDTLINTTPEPHKIHPLASLYVSASSRQNTFNPVYDKATKDRFFGSHGIEFSIPIDAPIDLKPLLNHYLINKVLIPAARLRDQGKIGAILILSNTTVKKQLTWFDQYMLNLTGSVGQFQSLRKEGKDINSKPFNNGRTAKWQNLPTSRIDWEDKPYFFDYIMERNNRARGDLTLIEPSKIGCSGLSCTGSNAENDLAWSRKTTEHVKHMTKKLGIMDPRNIFFFDDLSPTIERRHPMADELKGKYVHIRSKEPGGEVRDGYGVLDKYDYTGNTIKLTTETVAYEDATVYPQALLDILAEASTPANVRLNLRAAENDAPLAGGKRRRITKHKKTLKRRPLGKKSLTKKRKTKKQRGGGFSSNYFPDFWKPSIEEAKKLFIEAERLDKQAEIDSRGVSPIDYFAEGFFINGSMASVFHIDYFLSVELPELEKIMNPVEIDEIVEIMHDYISLYPKPHDLDLFLWSGQPMGTDVFDGMVPKLFDYDVNIQNYDFKGWKYSPKNALNKGRHIFETIDYGYLHMNRLNVVPLQRPTTVDIYGCNLVGLRYLYERYKGDRREKNKKRITLLEYLLSTLQKLDARYPHLQLAKNHAI